MRRRCWIVCWLGIMLVSGGPTLQAEPAWVKGLVGATDSLQIDNAAPAVILLESFHADIKEKGESKGKFCQAVKILSPEGAEEAPFNSWTDEYRQVKNIRGWLIRPDGETLELKKDWIVEIADDYKLGFYDENTKVTASFPEVRTGDIVAFECDLIDKDRLTGFHHGFTFDHSGIPILSSRYEIEIPNDWNIQIFGQGLDDIEYTEDGNRHTWSYSNLAYFPDEPFSPPGYVLRHRIKANITDNDQQRNNQFTNWTDVVQWTRGLHSEQIVPDDEIIAKTTELCSGLDSPTEKIKRLARFVQDEIRYVAIELGIGRFQPRSASSIMHNRFGDCKDKATLLRSMLSVTGVSSEVVLAMTEEPVDESFPSPFQFNHCIVAIPSDNLPAFDPDAPGLINDWVYFDPTSTTYEFGQLPPYLRGTRLLKTAEQDTTVQAVPKQKPTERSRTYLGKLSIGEDESCAGRIVITDREMWASQTRHWWENSPQTECVKDMHDMFSTNFSTLDITNLTFEDFGDSTQLDFELKGTGVISKAGDMILLKADPFHIDQSNELSSKTRLTPVYFGSPKLIETNVIWTLPGGWSAAPDTTHKSSSCEQSNHAVRVVPNDQSVQFWSLLRLEDDLIAVEEYETARKFWREVRDAQKTRIFIESQ